MKAQNWLFYVRGRKTVGHKKNSEKNCWKSWNRHKFWLDFSWKIALACAVVVKICCLQMPEEMDVSLSACHFHKSLKSLKDIENSEKIHPGPEWSSCPLLDWKVWGYAEKSVMLMWKASCVRPGVTGITSLFCIGMLWKLKNLRPELCW